MAQRIAILGEPNSGKSYSRSFITNSDSVFVLAPSDKKLYLKKSDGNRLDYFNISTQKLKTTEEVAKVCNKNTDDICGIIDVLTKKGIEFSCTGNYIVNYRIEDAGTILNIISSKMIHINTVIIPDFTHFISAEISEIDFIKRKSGGDAFAKYLELAANSLNSFIKSVDLLRKDLIVVTEYHIEYDEIDGNYHIFVPGGKMMVEKFKLDSYYDYILYTKYIDDNNVKFNDRFKFVVRRDGKYNARSSGIFGEQILVPNNLQIVLEKVREDNGIK
jgi:hypothetical protein